MMLHVSAVHEVEGSRHATVPMGPEDSRGEAGSAETAWKCENPGCRTDSSWSFVMQISLHPLHTPRKPETV